MKKILMAMAALPLLLAACGSDDDNLTVSPSSAEIKCGETVTLTASNKNVTWSSLDATIATVSDKGVVTGTHVGEVRIQAVDNNGNGGSADITVVASNNNFKAPLLSWKSSVAAIESAMATWNLTLDEKQADALTYTTNGSFPMYSYGFTNDGLNAAILAVSTEQDDTLDLEEWLDDRYWYVGESDSDFVYYDAPTEEAAQNIIVYGYNTTLDCVTVTWTPKDNTKAFGGSDAARNAAMRSLRVVLGK